MTLDELRRLEREATKGPWRACGGYTPEFGAVDSPDGYVIFRLADWRVDRERGEPINAPSYEFQLSNRNFIAALRNAAPVLLEVAEAAKALKTKYEVDGEAACEMEIAALFAAVEKMEGMQ